MPSQEPLHIERHFAKNFSSLNSIFEFVDAFIRLNRLNDEFSFAVRFSVEEVFTNMVKYNPNGRDVGIELRREPGAVIVDFVDVEKEPYDITARPDVDVNVPMEQRRPGGLGVFLVKKMMDSVTYSHDGVHSRITLTKHLEPTHV
jgi:serine/threonine-protein kinase RsbW